MDYCLRNIRIPVCEITKDNELELIIERISKKLNALPEDIKDFRILKESIDARRKNNISVLYSVAFSVDNIKFNSRDAEIIEEDVELENKVRIGNIPISCNPVIIGAGPAGLFAAWLLAEYGFNPVVVERGAKVEKRVKEVEKFWKTGILNQDTNVQFGEGGAGTFSDGKLTTRINDIRCRRVLSIFKECGAPEDILYKSKPHIGTDILRRVVVNMRKAIEKKGGTFLFESRVEDIGASNGIVKNIKTNNGIIIDTEIVILAIGHSARDTFSMLLNKGVVIETKPFSVGFRIEHLQKDINYAQYGKYAGHFKLKEADYQLSCRINGRGVYTFCMCPGGIVVASASEEDMLVTNGMSEYKRDKENANSAIVVSVSHKDFIGKSPLAGVEYQRFLEKRAFKAGKGSFTAPVQRVEDFLKNRSSKRAGRVLPSYMPGVYFTNLNDCLPKYIVNSIKEGIINMDKKLTGFADSDAILTAVESRTSSPVRILRNKEMESVSISGLYPIGEGAGYAGGIMSAAVDGLRAAEKIIEKFKPSKSLGI